METSDDPKLPSFLQKIYNLKLTIVLLIFTILTGLLFFADNLANSHPEHSWSWFREVPWEALAGATLSVVLIAFGYEWYARRESNEIMKETMRAVEKEVGKSLLADVQRALLLDPQSIRNVLSDRIVNEVILAGLERRTGDPVLAKETYDTLVAQISSYDRRAQNYRCKVTMAPVSKDLGTEIGRLYYESYIDIRYSTKLLRTDLWFTAVNDIEDYNKLIQDPTWETRVIRPPTRSFPVGDDRAFALYSVKVNELNLRIETGTHHGFSGFVARHEELANLVGQEVTFQYRYSTKMEKTGHVYMQTVTFPTRNVAMEFEYGLVDIGRVNAFDFFVTSRTPSFNVSKTADGPRSVEVELNDWVLPKSGVLFSWVLSSEMHKTFKDIKTLEDAQPSQEDNQA